MSLDLPCLDEPDLGRLARAWRAIDPSSTNRVSIDDALGSGPAAVRDMFGAPLTFGTAGLRGPLGPGPGAMNRVFVRSVARALGAFVQERGGAHVVIGYDARHDSDLFAHDTARVLASLDVRATLIDVPGPTPLVAFAVRHLGADAGVMVTASHNPRSDNGYKVYGEHGALLTSPDDTQLAELIASAALVDPTSLAAEDDERIFDAGSELVDSYLDYVISLLTPAGSRSARVAYTPLHGVGNDLLSKAFDRAGFVAPVVVTEEALPDGDFPGMAFPNPEEPGVLRRLFATASSAQVDLALAHDPDADRLAVAIPSGAGWRLFTGDELGCLLGDYLLAKTDPTCDPLVLNTVVSSRLLGEIAHHHGAKFKQTLTGFKWIMHEQAQLDACSFVLGYEEALGYAVGDQVRDKDGISAALVVAEMAGALADQGRTLRDALDDLHRRHGVHISGQRALRVESGGPAAPEIMNWLRSSPPREIAGEAVLRVDDLLTDPGPMPATDGLVLHLQAARITVRPSGTEPKLKVYGECWRPATGELAPAQTSAHEQLATLINAFSAHVCDPERAATTRRLGASRRDNANEQRALALFGTAPASISRIQALRLIVESIDLTTLAGDDTQGRVRALCAHARRPDPADATVGPTAAVCVYPNLVATASQLTAGSGVAVASVAAAFPSGLSSLEVRLSDIAEAVSAGADEVDVVLNRAAFLAGDHQTVSDELTAMRLQVGARVLKVILETSELGSPAAIHQAATLAMDAGTDWIKTSTGKSSTGATPLAVLTMAQAIDHHPRGEAVGLKVSGGVRTSNDALGYLAIIEDVLGQRWLDPRRVRFGASGLLTAVVEDLWQAAP